MTITLIVEVPDKWDVNINSPIDCIAGATFDRGDSINAADALQNRKYERSTSEGGYDARRQNRFEKLALQIPEELIPAKEAPSLHDMVCTMSVDERRQFAESNSYALLLLSEASKPKEEEVPTAVSAVNGVDF